MLNAIATTVAEMSPFYFFINVAAISTAIIGIVIFIAVYILEKRRKTTTLRIEVDNKKFDFENIDRSNVEEIMKRIKTQILAVQDNHTG